MSHPPVVYLTAKPAMQRRKFIRGAAAGAVSIASSQVLPGNKPNAQDAQPSLIEWREYELAFRGNNLALRSYLDSALKPALERKGAGQIALFGDYAQQNPGKLYMMVAYPDAATYVDCQTLDTDTDYTSAAADYDAMSSDEPTFARYSSWLLEAFSTMPQAVTPDEDAGLFELRVYEGHNEDAVRRKIAMFNDEEIDVFNATGLKPVFFGDMLAGPYRPSLVYLLQFEDMEARDANWSKFVSHPDWLRMKDDPKYADTVSNIRREFLVRPG